MSKIHKIQWTDKTQNPITVKGGGHYCVKVSPGCANCYAEKMNARKLAGGAGLKYRVMPSYPKMALNRAMLASWARARKPKKIFVGSMTDIFGEWVNDRYIFELLTAMAEAPKLTFQVLTKRPERMSQLVSAFLRNHGKGQLPKNIWLGTSIENQEVVKDRYTWLCNTLSQVRFLSLEPLLGSITLPYIIDVDWVIVGGESGPKARSLKIEWIESVIEQCQDSNIPVFVKQLGTAWARANGAKESKGGAPDEWPERLRIRQFPEEK